MRVYCTINFEIDVCLLPEAVLIERRLGVRERGPHVFGHMLAGDPGRWLLDVVGGQQGRPEMK